MARGGSRATGRPAGPLLLVGFALLALAWLGQGTARATYPGDNGQIAFVRDSVVRAVNTNGTGETFLTCRPGEVMGAPTPGHDAFSSFASGPVLWSPDGRRIAFMTTEGGGGLTAQWLLVLNPNGSPNLLGLDGVSPTWSPDGERIAFSTFDVFGDRPDFVAVANRDGSDRTTLAEAARSPAWSPDGGRIAFVRDRGAGGIWIMNADGSGQTHLGSGGSPTWSPDGERIAFTRFNPESSTSEIWAMSADGSDQTLVAERAESPTWSPEGRRIAFERKASVSDWPPDTWVMNADGSGQTLVAERAYRPTWSPDGRKIAFGRGQFIWVMNANGSRQARVAEGGNDQIDWQAIPPGTEGNPGPSQFCFTGLRRNTNRGIARLVVEVSRPGRVVLRRGRGVRPFARAHREAGPGRVVLPIRPRGRVKRKLESRATARLPVPVRVTYRPRAGEPRTRSGRITLIKAPRRCRDVNNERVRVIRIQGTLGCKRIRRLAAATVHRTGYLENRRFSCGWIEDFPEFPTVEVKGTTYTKGYCQPRRGRLRASFLGRQKKAGLWGRTFTSTAVTEDGEPRPLVPGTRIRVGFRPVGFQEGRGRLEWLAGCGYFAPDVRVTAKRLRVSEIVGSSAGCAEDRQRQDGWLREFFASDPRWRLRDRKRLVLRSAGTVIRLRDRG